MLAERRAEERPAEAERWEIKSARWNLKGKNKMAVFMELQVSRKERVFRKKET